MSIEPLRVLVTGAAGQISYSLLPMILSGQVFGEKQPIILHLLEISAALNALSGVIMELEDCAFDLLRGIVATSDIRKAFSDVDVAFLVGAMPRRDGMERKHLLAANVKIFEEQGRALNDYAKKSVLVLVVGNPANTNCYICATSAPHIPRKNFSAMTFLDQNRARAMIAKKHGTCAYYVRNAFIWGNHSSTQYPDASEAVVFDGKNIQKVVNEAYADNWLNSDFVKGVQQRGAEVIKARKASSAMSAAKAAADHMKAWWNNGFDDGIVSMAVLYNASEQDFRIPSDLVFSYPVRISNREWFVAKDAFDYARIESQLGATIKELIEERNEAKKLCNL